MEDVKAVGKPPEGVKVAVESSVMDSVKSLGDPLKEVEAAGAPPKGVKVADEASLAMDSVKALGDPLKDVKAAGKRTEYVKSTRPLSIAAMRLVNCPSDDVKHADKAREAPDMSKTPIRPVNPRTCLNLHKILRLPMRPVRLRNISKPLVNS